MVGSHGAARKRTIEGVFEPMPEPIALPPVVVIARDATRRHAIVEMAAYAGLQVAGAFPSLPGETDGENVYIVDGAIEAFDIGPAVMLGGETGSLSQAGWPPMAYLAATPEPAQLAAAVVAVHAGLTAHAPRTLSLPDHEVEELTPREADVLRLLAGGHSNREIGARLGISENTVKFHVGAILAKLSAQTRAEAVMSAVRRGLLPL